MGFNTARKAARLARRQAKGDAKAFEGAAMGPNMPWGASSSLEGRSSSLLGRSSSLEGRSSSLQGRSTPLTSRPTPPTPSGPAPGDSSKWFDPEKGTMGNMAMRAGSRLSQFGDGWDIAKKAGGHALRGAVAGGAIGGTSEWAQGGSFWAGAKEGAFNGAVGWSGYRMLGHATGATSKNPFSRQGAFGALSKDFGGISKQVRAITELKKNVNKVVK